MFQYIGIGKYRFKANIWPKVEGNGSKYPEVSKSDRNDTRYYWIGHWEKRIQRVSTIKCTYAIYNDQEKLKFIH